MFNTIRKLFVGQMENGLYEKIITTSTMTGLVGGSFYGATEYRRYEHASLYDSIKNSCLCGVIGIPAGLVIGMASPLVLPVFTVSSLIGMSVYGFYEIRKQEKSQNTDSIIDV